MARIIKELFVNGILTTVTFPDFPVINEMTHAMPATAAAALNISRRDIVRNADVRVLEFHREGHTLTVSSEAMLLDGVTIKTFGYTRVYGLEMIPLQAAVESFGGSYAETETEITVDFPIPE